MMLFIYKSFCVSLCFLFWFRIYWTQRRRRTSNMKMIFEKWNEKNISLCRSRLQSSAEEISSCKNILTVCQKLSKRNTKKSAAHNIIKRQKKKCRPFGPQTSRQNYSTMVASLTMNMDTGAAHIDRVQQWRGGDKQRYPTENNAFIFRRYFQLLFLFQIQIKKHTLYGFAQFFWTDRIIRGWIEMKKRKTWECSEKQQLAVVTTTTNT